MPMMAVSWKVNEMTVFYKATRPDGTDFYTGTVDYGAALASGKPLPELSGDDVAFPGPGWYHAATVPTECVGVLWPCRLFEVEPVGDVMMDSAHPHKIGCRSVRVLREIEAHRVFGPQGEQVAALIERCRVLSGVEVDRLAVAWNATRGATRNRDAAWAATFHAARDAAREAAWDAAWHAAWAAGDATRGLLLRDLIGQRHGWDQAAYDALTGPWRRTIGPIHPDDAPMSDYLRGRIDKQERIRNVMAGER